MKKERALILFKPDAVQRGIVGEILSRFEKVGLKIIALKMLDAKEEQLAEHYYKDDEWLMKKGEGIKKNKGYPEDYDAKTAGQEIVDGLMRDMKISPIIAMVLEGYNAIHTVRRLAGPTNINEAMPGTIRGDYAHDTFDLANVSNRPIITVIHATDDAKDSQKEINIWFNPSEVHSYDKPDEGLHYRKFE
ncbi:MAG: nucleoside-diphosphate kinase [Candidatus Pacearchaeota archaeon]|nr:nucleoside-diphosphate kinase [Candidatus Pacearchaeota archaeon]